MTSAIPADEALDLSACTREPIHIPGAIQPHGYLVACGTGSDHIVEHASDNVHELVAEAGAQIVGQPLGAWLPKLNEILATASLSVGQESQFLQTVSLLTSRGERQFDLALHRAGSLDILELEEAIGARAMNELAVGVNQRLRLFVNRLQSLSEVDGMCELAAQEVRQITDFDRVLVYRFDEDWNGTVVAEDGNGVLPSYLDLRFPASDIPAQARDLYRRNRLRIIPDASYRPVPVIAAPQARGGPPLDMSFAMLRAVSPVHVEYMRNMGTMASMSVSIIVRGRLWGLISCHNREPRRVALALRNACDFLAQVLAMQVGAREHAAEAERRMQLGAISARLLAYMAEQERFTDGLIGHPDDLISLTGAMGAALVSTQECYLLGQTPCEADVRQLHEWLTQEHGEKDIFATDTLSGAYAPARAYAETASGLLAISISKKYTRHILWFRPEVVQTVSWGGDPTKAASVERPGEPTRLHPRKSFETWKEILRGRSLPWSEPERDVVKELRNAILGIVLRRAEEMASLSEELQRSNKELEAFSYSVSHDLRAPFRHIVGFAELLKKKFGSQLDAQAHRYVDTIIESAFSAGTLVDNLLSFSQMGRTALTFVKVDMNAVVQEARRAVERDTDPERNIVWNVAELGHVFADAAMLRLVLENLLSNAVKYSRDRDPAVIQIGVQHEEDEQIFHVQDNGIGFDMAYVGKLFGVFQRLHRMEEFEGTGIGLANVRRIIERHGGRTWAEGSVGQGATFYFALPERGERP